MELKKVTSRCKPINVGSYKVLEKCGMQYHGIVKGQMRIKGTLEDMRMYTLTMENYKEAKNKKN